jgi:hypothetical protein
MKTTTSKGYWTIIGLLLLSAFASSGTILAQDYGSKGVSIGFILGDPLGVTMKYRLSAANAIDVEFGPDYFGSPRLQIDDIWEFDTFRSNIICTYAGPGLAVAFAKGITPFFSKEPRHESFANLEDNKFGFGGRAIFGMNITPQRSPIEFFLEGGPLVGINHILDLDLDAAIGMRYRL